MYICRKWCLEWHPEVLHSKLFVWFYFFSRWSSLRELLWSPLSKQTLSIKGKIHYINSFYKHFLKGLFTACLIRHCGCFWGFFCFCGFFLENWAHHFWMICWAWKGQSNLWAFLDMGKGEICDVALIELCLRNFTSGILRLCSSWRLIHMIKYTTSSAYRGNVCIFRAHQYWNITIHELISILKHKN